MGSDVVECSGTRSLRAWSVVVVAAVVMTFLAVEGSSAGVAPVVGAPGCTIVGTPGDDVLEGTPGDDVICGRGGDDRLVGRGGDDQLRGGRGDDELSGRGGDDLARGEQGKDVIKGGGGDDRLRGGKGNDQLDGRDAGAFTDIVRCGPGTADRAFADMGDDVVSGCEVVNQNDPPTDIRLEPATVAENSPVGTLVGTLEAKDPDPGDKHSFSLVAGPGGGDNGSFTIQGTQLLTAAALDFEVHASLSVRVRATDLEGATYARSLTVTVGDVSENSPPVAVDDVWTAPEDANLTMQRLGAVQPGGQRHRRRRRHPVRDRRSRVPWAGRRRSSGSTDPCSLRHPTSVGSLREGSTTRSSTVAAARTPGRFTVDITCVPDDPTAVDDAVTRVEDTAGAAIAVLANDHDADGDPLVIDSVTQPANGTVTITGGGAGLTYEPDPDYCKARPRTRSPTR